MASSRPQDPFFKPIGEAAEAVDALPDEPEADRAAEGQSAAEREDGEGKYDDVQPVDSIESLCLECGKNVGLSLFSYHRT